MNEKFSIKHGFRDSKEAEITIRNDAPHEFRGILIALAYECGYGPTSLRSLVCKTLRKRPDKDNWSEYPNMDDEVHGLIDDCEWYRVYDIVEAISQSMKEAPYSYDADKFESEVNSYFIENGIGWQIIEGNIEVRGPELFEEIVQTSKNLLKDTNRDTAHKELHEALTDLSRRPTPDITGAIHHSMASLECVARDVCGDQKASLGEILKRYKGLIPQPLDQTVKTAWGYASENARHIREGREPTFEEAELIVGICATVTNYLARKEKL